MFKLFCKIIFWLKGWKLNENVPKEAQKCVVIAAPHTSNWDLIYTIAAFSRLNIPLRFTIKKEWMRFPFGIFLGSVGALGIDRSPKNPNSPRKSMVEAMADLFTNRDKIAAMVTPEGSRKKMTKWKTGFYYTALQANVPICLGYLDYAKKEAGIGKVVFPSGDFEKDFYEIMLFYSPIPAKYPELFALDESYEELKQKYGNKNG